MKKITKLSVFDFDGTLVKSPTPENGKEIYKTKTGNDWPYIGWFSKHESLDLNIFDIETIDDVIVDYEREAASKSSVVVMLTGRILKLSEHVKIVLGAKGLVFDEYEFNRGGSTEISKMRTMDKLLFKYKDVIEVELWDDRLPHIPIFEQWGKAHVLSGRLKDFKVNVVLGWDGDE
jgi:hypothetical protein